MVAFAKPHLKPHTPDTSAKDSGLRFYSPEISRWLNRDPLEELASQDSHPYRFVNNSPANRIDNLGLFGHSVHFALTKVWAEERGIDPLAAEWIGQADIDVDSPQVIAVLPLVGNQERHFDRPWGGPDSRLTYRDDNLANAKEECTWLGTTNPKDDAEEAATFLGRALHATQDYVAHGDYGAAQPGAITHIHNVYGPPMSSSAGFSPSAYPDLIGLDVVGSADGRPVLAAMWVEIQPSLVLGMPIATLQATYVLGPKRKIMTKYMTQDVLSAFQAHVIVKSKPCGQCRKVFLSQ
jgi:RHS repeat-associated protein